MGITAGYLLIAICGFYLIRNTWAGSVLYPLVNYINRRWSETGSIGKGKIKKMELRNYYLFVLNPLWWSWVSVFKRKEDRQTMKQVSKLVRDFYSNSQR